MRARSVDAVCIHLFDLSKTRHCLRYVGCGHAVLCYCIKMGKHNDAQQRVATQAPINRQFTSDLKRRHDPALPFLGGFEGQVVVVAVARVVQHAAAGAEQSRQVERVGHFCPKADSAATIAQLL